MRLAAFILSNMEPILQEWEDFARDIGVESELDMDRKALRDHAKLILQAVAQDLITRQTDAQQEAKGKGDAPEPHPAAPDTAAETHGSQRAEEGFSLQQMVSEYRALRASVLRLWAREENPCDADAYQQLMRFNEAIDEALADSIETYSVALDQMFASRARDRLVALGTLASGLGHDMANLLLPMRLSLDHLSKMTPAGSAEQVTEHAELLASMRRTVEHLRGLTKGLRSLSVDPDDPAASTETTLLSEWWQEAVSPLTWALPAGVALHAEGLKAELPAVAVPRHVLMQAVFNLVQNAAEALREKGASAAAAAGTTVNASKLRPGSVGNIWLEAAATEKGERVTVTVRDDGPGMDAVTLARCTDMFFTTKPRDRGTGLGLALVRSSIERHAGRLTVTSIPGNGAAFIIELPTAPAASSPLPRD